MDESEKPFLTDRELRKLSRFMLPGNPIRKAAKALLERDYAALDNPDFYLGVLDNPIGPLFKRRMIAAEALRFTELTPEMAESVEAKFRRITSYRHIPPVADFTIRALNVVSKYVIVYSLIFALGYWMTTFIRSDNEYDIPWPFMLLFVFGMILFFAVPIYSIVRDAVRYRRLRSVCAIGLGRWGGPASVETLIDMSGEGELWSPARDALKRVLMRLTPQDYGKVSPLGVRMLSDSFRQPLYPDELDEWVPLLLDSLEKVGTGASVEGVQILAKRGRKKEWQDHALKILPTLMERQRLERDSSRLLRPTMSDEKLDSLLRPASSSNADEDENLLRAVNTES